MSPENTDALARITLPFHSLRHAVDTRRAQRREAEAFRRAGQELANSPAAAGNDQLRPFLTALSRHQVRLDTTAAALAKSHDRESADRASSAPWLRPVIMLHGLAERALLHYQVQQFRSEMGVCHEALGRAASRASATALPVDRWAPDTGAPDARWLTVMGSEARALGAAVWHQLHGKLVPRASALAGLAAGWWVASTYTDSHLRSIMNTVGLGRGGTHVVSSTTFKAMNFWLPILAAALCAYLGDRLARTIKNRGDDLTGLATRPDD